MSNWPSQLPQQLFLGTSQGDEESRLISQMDAGPALVRNRFTAATRKIETPMVLTGEQLVIFNTFYRTTLNNGANSFTWTDPVSDDSVTYRFKSPPVWQSVESGSPSARIWQATLSLEILP